MLLQVDFVSNYNDGKVRPGESPCVSQPGGDVIVGVLIGDIINDQGARCSSVVRARDGSKPFLTCSVSYLELQFVDSEIKHFAAELYSDGVSGRPFELLFDELVENARLPGIAIAY